MKKNTIKFGTIFNKLGNFQSNTLFISPVTSRPVNNHFVLHYENGDIFQSYGTTVAIKLRWDNTIYLTEDHEYSPTTSKYLKHFTGYNKQQRLKMLETGEAKLIID